MLGERFVVPDARLQTLALTFDDGPHPLGTVHVLEVLERHRVPATFFLWGEQASLYPDVVRQLLASGHSVQPHCWAHASHWTLTPRQIQDDIDKVLNLLRDLGVPRPYLWRPPYGHVLRRVTQKIASQRGLVLAGWTVNPHDYGGTSVAEMHRIVCARLRNDAPNVVIMHDGYGERGQRRIDASNTVMLLEVLLNHNVQRFVALTSGLEGGLSLGPVGLAGQPGLQWLARVRRRLKSHLGTALPPR
jgi:peptidoglycan/xylan/chitin deacetylase (PgdA/CDA1 family)